MRYGIPFFVLLSVSSSLYSQAVRVHIVGQVKTRGSSAYSSCWGYVAPNGHEYALLGCGGGTQIVDISDTTLPEVAFIPGPGSGWREMKVYQHYAYVVTEGTGAGLQIIDLDSMKLVNTLNTVEVPSGHTISIEGKFLYINGGRYLNGGMVVLDLTDPVHPVYKGSYQRAYVHDCYIRNDTIYAAEIKGEGLDIIDGTNKANLKRIVLIQYPFNGTHNTALSADGNYVYTTDEVNGDPSGNGNVLRVWDRREIQDIHIVATYVATPYTRVHNIYVKGDFGYIAHFTEGLRIVDLKDPSLPVEVASYDTYSGSENATVGAWGTFPYFASNKVIISDTYEGLFVVEFPGENGSIKVARVLITVKDSSTNLPIYGVKAVILGLTDTATTYGDGRVKFGSLADSLTVSFSKSASEPKYFPKVETIRMKYDSVVAVTIVLRPTSPGLSVATLGSEPLCYALLQNYPNPFNPGTVIRYQLAVNTHITLRVVDVLGREVAVLVNAQKGPGNYEVEWNASNFSSGVYLVRMEARPTNGQRLDLLSGQAGNYSATRKILLMK